MFVLAVSDSFFYVFQTTLELTGIANTLSCLTLPMLLMRQMCGVSDCVSFYLLLTMVGSQHSLSNGCFNGISQFLYVLQTRLEVKM